MKRFLLVFLLGIFGVTSQAIPQTSPPEKRASFRPNILWIVVEDMSDHWSCYGESSIETPNIDQLAAEGELFENAFVTSPVCSPSRSALITGMYQTTIGAHNHRSQIIRGKGGGNAAYYESFQLPAEVPFLPRLLQEAGYYTVMGGESKGAPPEAKLPHKRGKTDYNFEWDPNLYDGYDWRDRAPGQPFFAQIQLRGGKYRDVKLEKPVDPNKVNLPPYYPDDEVLREDWAQYLNSILHLDRLVKDILDRLKAENIADSTAVFLFTDHGISHLRGKQFLYDDGIKIPLLIKWPGVTQAARRRTDLVSHIDIAATTLQMAGLPQPTVMQGQPLYGADYQPRDYIFAARDRCDETVDMIRAVRTRRFKYIRNFFPHKSHAQPNRYKDRKVIIQHLREQHAGGQLQAQTGRYFQPVRPVEELYDLVNDPLEMHNLAADPDYRQDLQRMQNLLFSTLASTQDLGVLPEPIAEAWGGQYGGKAFIFQQPENQGLFSDCIETMGLDEQGDLYGLSQALEHEQSAVRFWAAYGLGNRPQAAYHFLPQLEKKLQDDSEAVRIAAARALCRMDPGHPSLSVLADHLQAPNLIVGLYAILFIEDLEENQARQLLPEIRAARQSPYEFTKRVADRMAEKMK